MISATRAII